MVRKNKGTDSLLGEAKVRVAWASGGIIIYASPLFRKGEPY